MSSINELLTKSRGQNELGAEWETIKSREKQAKDNLKKLKKAKPQDTNAIDKANQEIDNIKKDKDIFKSKQKAFNEAQKSRILGGDESKTDTVNKPTDINDTKNVYANKTGDKVESTNGHSNNAGNKDNETSETKGKEKMNGLSDRFYDSMGKYGATASRDMNAILQDRRTGNEYDAAAATAGEIAQDARNAASNRDMEAQKAAQEGNRNKFSEAGKIASYKNDQQNQQKIQNSGNMNPMVNALRQTNVADVEGQQNYMAQQRTEGNTLRKEADKERFKSTENEGLKKQYEINSRDDDYNKNKSTYLALGGTDGGKGGEGTGTDPQPPVNEEPEEQPDPPSQEPPKPGVSEARPQKVVNYLLGTSSSDPNRDPSGITPDANSQDGSSVLLAEVLQKFNVKPAPKGTFNDPMTAEEQWASRDDEYGTSANKRAAMQYLRQERNFGNDASRNFNNGEQMGTTQVPTASNDANTQQQNTPSDIKIKNVMRELSDLRMKHIRQDLADGYMSPEDFMHLAIMQGGKFKYNDNDYDFFSDDFDDEDDSVMDSYADNIRNYVYTYKNEATSIDPSIDTNEEHIGPMAQDIEKVNPACIKETSSGVKTVDTSRLALMNAGVIGDLARKLESIEQRLAMIGV